MFLSPIKGKIQGNEFELKDIDECRGRIKNTFWDEYCHDPYTDAAYPLEYRCPDFAKAVSQLIALVSERMSEYYIPGTDFSYFLLAMRVFDKMGRMEANNDNQLAGLAWVAVYHRFVSVDEIREICGEYAARLVTIRRCTCDELNEYEEFYAIDDEHESGMFIVPTWIQWKFIQIETALILEVLRKIRAKHDLTFCEENPMPKEFWKENEAPEDCCPQADNERGFYPSCPHIDDDPEKYGIFAYGADKPYGRRTIEYDYHYETTPDDNHGGLSYYKKGFFNQEYTEYEDDHYPGEVVKYLYTTEYKDYCDKCRDLFWKRFGLTYEKAEQILIKLFWDGSSPWNPVNDLLYEVKKQYYICKVY